MDTENIFRNTDNNFEANINEALRYMGSPNVKDTAVLCLAEESLKICKKALRPKSVYRFCKIISLSENSADFGFFKLTSNSLCKNLKGCTHAAFFVATIGNEIDFLIKKHSFSKISEAVSINSVGAAFIESYCDYINKIIKGDMEKENMFLKPRFSPGYGDLPLECEEDIFRYLNATKNTGVYLTESHMMIPSKSVCAIIGITPFKNETTNKEKNKCDLCKNKNCEFERRGKS